MHLHLQTSASDMCSAAGCGVYERVHGWLARVRALWPEGAVQLQLEALQEQVRS